MLSDRPYMRDDTGGHVPLTVLTWLICTVLAGFVLENVCFRWFGAEAGQVYMQAFALSPEAVSKGFLWTLLTHGAVHDAGQLLSLVTSLLMLFVFGRVVLPAIGPKPFIALVAVAIAAGGLAWLALNWGRHDQLYGTSAAVCALIVVFARLSPEQPVSPFFVNLGLRAKHLALALLVFELVALVFWEIPGRTAWFAFAPSAHLGGIAAGWLYVSWLQHREAPEAASKPAIELPRWFKRRQAADASPAPAFKVNLEEPEDLRAEIDRILDKINSDGFQSLTAEEKHRLDLARDHLSRR